VIFGVAKTPFTPRMLPFGDYGMSANALNKALNKLVKIDLSIIEG
jgi:hypothetical protein